MVEPTSNLKKLSAAGGIVAALAALAHGADDCARADHCARAGHPAVSNASPIVAVITRDFIYLNYIEAGLWIALAFGAGVQSFRFTGPVRRELLILAIDLIAFGLSDVAETRTGAWWRPWWLLAWKGACVGVMLVLLTSYVRRRLR